MAKTGPKGPYALNDIVAEKIIAALKRGNMRHTACHMARVCGTAIDDWMKLSDREPYLSFCLRVRDAEAFAEDEGVSVIKAGEPGWQGMAWWIERRYKRWSKEVAAAKAKLQPAANSNDLEEVELADLERAIHDAAEVKRLAQIKNGTER